MSGTRKKSSVPTRVPECKDKCCINALKTKLSLSISFMACSQDDKIVVSQNPGSGKNWTLGEVRRFAVDEWLRPDQEEVAEPAEKGFPAFYIPGKNKFLDEIVKPSAINRTLRDADTLIFNRVPKCASSTMNELLQSLSQINNFEHNSWRVFWYKQLTAADEMNFLTQILEDKVDPSRSVAVDRHVYFIETTRDYHERRRVNWVNMVRDPVDRFVSLFYYLRSEKRWEKLQESRPPQSWFDKDLSRCIMSGDLECQFSPENRHLKEQQLTFFCGSAPECKVVGSRAALQKAKYNAEKYYSVIGVVSDLESSLSVMEHYLPKYFSGVSQIYRQMGISNLKNAGKDSKSLLHGSNKPQFKKNETPNKKELSHEARAILAANMTLEYEFYLFVKERLRQQKRSIGVVGKLIRTIIPDGSSDEY